MLGTRFIVVAISEVNLIEPDPYYTDPVDAAKTEEAAAKAEAAVVLAARKRAYERTIVSCVGGGGKRVGHTFFRACFVFSAGFPLCCVNCACHAIKVVASFVVVCVRSCTEVEDALVVFVRGGGGGILRRWTDTVVVLGVSNSRHCTAGSGRPGLRCYCAVGCSCKFLFCVW